METKNPPHHLHSVFGDTDYLPLEALSMNLHKGTLSDSGSSFTLCFWIYLLKSSVPGPIISQGLSEGLAVVPLLVLDADRRLALHPLRRGDCNDGEASSVGEVVVSDQFCPLDKWVHVGCEIGSSFARLHMVGTVAGERHMPSPLEVMEGIARKGEQVLLFGGQGGHAASTSVHGYFYFVRLLPQPTVTNHYVKNPPLELLLDGPSGASDDQELEEGGDGVWSVVGGKASCRRNFALDVALLDALGRSVHKELELVAFLVFADTCVPVEKPKDDAEAPLLTTFDGVEFPSSERPIKLLHGRASFKLKISQLSSKCDNRLFRVCFDSPSAPKFPFLQAFSRPIRCVSRNRNHRMPINTHWKNSPATAASSLPLDGSVSSSGVDETVTTEACQRSARDDRCNNVTTALNGKDLCGLSAGQQLLKRTRTRLQRETSVVNVRGFVTNRSSHNRPGMMSPSEEVGSGLSSGLQSQKTVLPALSVASGLNWPDAVSVRVGPVQPGESRSISHQSGIGTTKQETVTEGSNLSTSTDVMNLSQRWNSNSQLSDQLVFKYCLENMNARAEFLKAFVMSRGEQELTDFATRVSQLTGCRHDGYQILIARNLVFSGNEVWSKVSQESVPPLWASIVRHINKCFTRTGGCVNRSLSAKDTQFLKRIAGCDGDYISREEFGRLWNWIYPVALAVRSSQLRTTWDNEDPRWIEGMISREEVEVLLKCGGATSKPGTFLLRFASSRLWPHPDSGALVVSYVDQDLRVNHKLLSLDENASHPLSPASKSMHQSPPSVFFSFNGSERPLLEQLLLQPELSQLCRVSSRNAAG